MWWVKGNADQSRGGFQNRDVGRSNFHDDFGPDYGVDYARFSDPPDLAKDARLKEELEREISLKFPHEKDAIELSVKNGFVILKGNISDEEMRREIISFISLRYGVREVINQLYH